MMGQGLRNLAASTNDSSCVLSPISATATRNRDVRNASKQLPFSKKSRRYRHDAPSAYCRRIAWLRVDKRPLVVLSRSMRIRRKALLNCFWHASPSRITGYLPPFDDSGSFRSGACSSQRGAGTFIPRCTAGRAPMTSYQRLTLGKSARSTLCHS